MDSKSVMRSADSLFLKCEVPQSNSWSHHTCPGSVVGCGRHDGKAEGGQDVGGLLTTRIGVELDAFAEDQFDRQSYEGSETGSLADEDKRPVS
jgi:hypothetical protein